MWFKSFSSKRRKSDKNFLSEFTVISIDQSIKDLAILFRKRYSLKIPDAIIAASAVSFEIPLVTSDKAFKQIKELQLDLYSINRTKA